MITSLWHVGGGAQASANTAHKLKRLFCFTDGATSCERRDQKLMVATASMSTDHPPTYVRFHVCERWRVSHVDYQPLPGCWSEWFAHRHTLILRYQGYSDSLSKRPQECARIQLTCESGPSQGTVWTIAFHVVLSPDSDDVVYIKPKWNTSATFAGQQSIDDIDAALADADRLFTASDGNETGWRLGLDGFHFCTIKSTSEEADGSSSWDITVQWETPAILGKPNLELEGPLRSFSPRSGRSLKSERRR